MAARLGSGVRPSRSAHSDVSRVTCDARSIRLTRATVSRLVPAFSGAASQTATYWLK